MNEGIPTTHGAVEALAISALAVVVGVIVFVTLVAWALRAELTTESG
jgi:hypothetical protein